LARGGGGVAVLIYDFDRLVLEDASGGRDGVVGPGTGGGFWPIEQYSDQQTAFS
jgi:hypothetical protein